MSKIVHVETVVRTVFGILDDEGDVIEKKPVSIALAKLNAESFELLAKTLAEAKVKLQDELDSVPQQIVESQE